MLCYDIQMQQKKFLGVPCETALTFQSADEIPVTSNLKDTEQYFPEVLFIVQ